jgi:hypothetical protein
MFLRALGESGTSAATAGRRSAVARGRRLGAGPDRLRGGEARIAACIAAFALALFLSACGSEERQDVTEPEGDFPVSVTRAKFPNHQRLAETSDLELAIKNVGQETIPDLAVTIYTGETKADGSFNIRLDDPSLADPNRPVWILENEYPKLLGHGVTAKNLGHAPSAGAAAARPPNSAVASA